MQDTGPFILSEVVFSSVPVRGGREWVFAEVSDREGFTGVAELTGPDASTIVAKAFAQIANEMKGEAIREEADVLRLAQLSTAVLERDRVLATAISGLRNAILDALAQRANVSLTEYLGGQPKATVELYGNINRSMLSDDDGPVDRSPKAFAEMAHIAADEGFATVKCAPFDECRAPFNRSGLPEEARPGLERVAAVRMAIGDDVTLLVDCHSRFDLESALALEPELHALGVAWFEEPVDPLEYPDALVRIREAARMPVAGAEMAYGVGRFRALLERSVLDVVMPDLKYCGGAGEAVAIGRALEPAHPGSVSFHCPSGPVSLLTSAHATAAFGGARPLEHAILEVPWRATVMEPAERVENGGIVIPEGPGLGARLSEAYVAAHGRQWTL